MQKIDAHQHFWQYNPIQHHWINEEMAFIRKDFLPQDLQPILNESKFDGCIAVQADQTEEETLFLMLQSAVWPFIKGVVGWVDLRSDKLEERLQFFKQFNIIKGFRHILQSEAPAFMLQKEFIKGINALKQYDFTYDILIYPKHLQAVIALVQQNPEQKFVIDHMAKPYIKAGLIDDWKKDLLELAQFENVYCKISGMVTEADYQLWKPIHFTPYLDVVVEAFGTKRIMYGSDWPVCLVAASYQDVLDITRHYFSSFSSDEQAAFFGGNAKFFYNL